MHNIIDIHIVPEGDYHIRIQEYAAQVFTLLPTRSAVKKALKRQELFINDQIANSRDWIQAGQIISYVEVEQTIPKVFPMDIPVHFEDEYLAVIQKPAGFPTNGNYYKTIENCLPHNLKPSSQEDCLLFPRPVHRLDNPTSGLLLVAKTKSTQRKLHMMFEKNEIQKEYQAVVAGAINGKFEIDTPLDDKTAKTIVEVVHQIPALQNQYLSMVNLKPLTGRTHQLRRHLSSIGNPIVGDRLYATNDVMKHKGLFLSSTKVTFIHPKTSELIEITTEAPNKFMSYLNREENRYLKYNS